MNFGVQYYHHWQAQYHLIKNIPIFNKNQVFTQALYADTVISEFDFYNVKIA